MKTKKPIKYEPKGTFECSSSLWEVNDEPPQCSYCGKVADRDESDSGMYDTPVNGVFCCDAGECKIEFCDEQFESITFTEQQEDDNEEEDG